MPDKTDSLTILETLIDANYQLEKELPPLIKKVDDEINKFKKLKELPSAEILHPAHEKKILKFVEEINTETPTLQSVKLAIQEFVCLRKISSLISKFYFYQLRSYQGQLENFAVLVKLKNRLLINNLVKLLEVSVVKDAELESIASVFLNQYLPATASATFSTITTIYLKSKGIKVDEIRRSIRENEIDYLDSAFKEYQEKISSGLEDNVNPAMEIQEIEDTESLDGPSGEYFDALSVIEEEDEFFDASDKEAPNASESGKSSLFSVLVEWLKILLMLPINKLFNNYKSNAVPKEENNQAFFVKPTKHNLPIEKEPSRTWTWIRYIGKV
ncbi:Dot/Icm T4SS effector protein CbEPF1 [Coxiella burnetii]|uniref:Dot/Icm T4SS effector protein CbEPF1 n=1 Tax=Coxiella burnetii TaxID=777 RepID=UPI000183D0C3|nr:CBU_1370 family Dot/Icm T4SS effector [Coxiella burnetii]ACJ18050.1 hypothetical membrane-associated protein [Coxiella burnetii CbuG_Q212]ATN66452.1 hypothetical protein AYM17_03035 [Coxiella burnetii]OYK86497.1 hypothetical protein CbuQ229_03180 [Coxiella burnetii]